MPNVTIANGQTVSSAAKIKGEVVGVITPAAFTGTTITFQVKNDAGTYIPVHVAAGTAYSLTVAAGRYTIVPKGTLTGCRDIKVVSGSAEAAERIVTLVVG